MGRYRILYAAYRHDPTNPDLASGSDYNFYHALAADPDFEMHIAGPLERPTAAPERVLRRLYHRLGRGDYPKFTISRTWYAAQNTRRVAARVQPDLIFSIFPPPLALYDGPAPTIYRQDTSFLGWHAQYPRFGPLPLRFLLWQEKRVFRRAARVITQSAWNRDVLVQRYGLPAEKVVMFPNPAALPAESIPAALTVREEKALESPLRLLLVGRQQHRKGVDIALRIVKLLNEAGCPAELTICGLDEGEENTHTHYVGSFRKSVPEELAQYANLYKRAHLLVHPARFEPAGIVPSEAAAFGTPTITNAAGGLATTVSDGESGIVLPMGSPPERYVEAIMNLIRTPERYYALCESARARYERELNWPAAGERVRQVVHEVLSG